MSDDLPVIVKLNDPELLLDAGYLADPKPSRRNRQLCMIGALLTAEHSTVGFTEVRTFRNEVTVRCSGFSDFDGLAREGLVCEEARP